MGKMVAGVDVSLRTLECKVSGMEQVVRVANTHKGRMRLLKKLDRLKVELVVLEATGGYEAELARLLWAGGIPVAVVNPRWIRHFARSEGRYAKSDRIDADVLVLYGERMQPEPTPPVPEEIERLRQLLRRREQLMDMLVQEKNHEKAPGVPAEIRKEIRQLRVVLVKQVKKLDAVIMAAIESSVYMKPRADRLRRETGVGPVLMATLIGDVPELGSMCRNEVAALIGVAPYDDDSGKHSGKRAIAGGRARPRRILYMATLSAIRHNEHLKLVYKRLVSRGKKPKVAIVACMRKFAIRLNTLLKEDPQGNFLAA
jgi:transposase